ncbi:hypothetical protein SDC9_06206 [bioreactor metagenome]|uniref:Uncharacterized protein n=1 Tax=bioreactor metagenome TaxID=1076179 RepID=A0A644T163_9ZZZZ
MMLLIIETVLRRFLLYYLGIFAIYLIGPKLYIFKYYIFFCNKKRENDNSVETYGM